MKFGLLAFLFLLLSQIGLAETFEFSAPGITIKKWDPQLIDMTKGIENIRLLDKWFSGLSRSEKEQYALKFAENRNRLFLVSQERRLQNEIQDIDQQSHPAVRWGRKANEVLKEEKKEQLDFVIRARKALFVDQAELSHEVIYDLNKYRDKDKTSPEIKKANLLNKVCGTNANCRSQLGRKIDGQLGGSTPEERAKTAISQFSGKVCEQDSIPPVPSSEYFDPKVFPKEAAFLKELKITSWHPKTSGTDLSGLYSHPRTQWKEGIPTAECVGFAVASDASFATKEKVDFSPQHTYAVMYNQEKERTVKIEVENPDYCNPQSLLPDESKGIMNMNQAIASLKKFPLCSTNRERYEIERFSSLDFEESKNHNIEATFLKILIDNGHPPILSMDSDARYEQEGWLFVQNGGKFRHVVNVVGYGKGIDPSTLCETEYFIIRDSLGKKEMHYKIPAKNLLSHLDSIFKITKLKKFGNNSTDIPSATNVPPASVK